MVKQLQNITRIYVYETLCPNRCEPSIEALKFGGEGGGGGGGNVNGEGKFFLFFFLGGGGGSG